jgi:hypothetical protein
MIGDDESEIDENEPPRYKRQRPGEAPVDAVFRSAFKARLLSERASSSYVSQIISMILSSDFTSMDRDSAAKKWNNYPVIFDKIFQKEALKSSHDVPGMAAVYFSLLHAIMKNRQQPPEWFDLIIARFFGAGYKSNESALRTLSSRILTEAERDVISHRWSEISTRSNRSMVKG